MSEPNPTSNELSPEMYTKLRYWLQDYVIRSLKSAPVPDLTAAALQQSIQAGYTQAKLNLSKQNRTRLFQEISQAIIGISALQPLLDDPDVTEIMINRHDLVYIEKEGRLEEADLQFSTEQDVLDLINQIILPLGKFIDRNSPMVDARLPDGSRVNAVIPPVAIDGANVTIRKFAKERLRMKDLFRYKSLSSHMGTFLQACVVSRLNIVVSGGTGSGKTSLLNILSEIIPDTERIVTIEDAAELQLHQRHVIRLEAKTADSKGEGEITIRSLVRNALRMRPDRIVVGEVRGGEALDMLQAMNTGHDGSLTTTHANTPRDATSRLETLTLLSGFDLPLRVIREQIAAAVDVIVQISRFRDGSRKITSISEVVGMEGETIVLTEIFKFEETDEKNGRIIGEFIPTGLRPMFENRLKAAGFHFPPEMFGADLMTMHPQGGRRRR